MKSIDISRLKLVSYTKYFIGCISFFIFLTSFIVLFMKIDSLYVHKVLQFEVKDLNDGYHLDNWIKKPHLRLMNSSGLMNKMYRGQKNRSAVFGGCTFNKFNILSDYLGSYFQDTYIENYSAGSMHCSPVIERLKKMKYKYKFIFVSTSCLSLNESKNFPVEIMFPSSVRILLELLIKAFLVSIENFIEKLFESFYTKPNLQTSHYPNLRQEIKKHKKKFKTIPEFDENDEDIVRFYRNNNLIAFYSIDIKDLLDKEKSLIRKELKELLFLAKEKAEKVYFITVPVAYDEEELSSVSLKWSNIHDWENRGIFSSVDNKTFAKEHRLKNKFMVDIAEEMNVPYIDLDSYLRKKLKYRDNLFVDYLILTPVGIRESVDYIMDQIK